MSEEDKNNQPPKPGSADDPFGNQGGWGSFDDVTAQEDWGSPTDSQSGAAAAPPPVPDPPAVPPAAPQPPAAPPVPTATPPIPSQQPAAPAIPNTAAPAAPAVPPVPPAPASTHPAPAPPRQPAAPLSSPTGGAVPPPAQPSHTPAATPPSAHVQTPAPVPTATPAPAQTPAPTAVAPQPVAASTAATGPAPTAAPAPAYGSATAVAVETRISVPVLLFIIMGFLVTAAFSSVVFIADFSRLGETDTALDMAKTRKLLLTVTDKGKIDRVRVTDAPPPEEPGIAAGNQAKKIKSIDVKREGSATTITIKTDGTVAGENHFKMSDPRRLVVELIGIEESAVSNVPGDNTRLDKIRIGKHENKYRLVLDLNYDVQVAVDKKPGKLIVRLSD